MVATQQSSDTARVGGYLALSQQGKAQIVLVDGPPASGKTHLLHNFSETALQSGSLVLSATASPSEIEITYGVLTELLQEHGFHPSPTAEGDAAGVSRAARAVVTALCAEQPVVLIVDDVQHADAPSLEVLLDLVRRLKNSRLLVVLGERVLSRPRLLSYRAELLRQPTCHRVRMLPLPVDRVAQLMVECLDEAAAERLAPAYHAVSGGNPALLNGLVEDALGHGVGPLPPEPVPGEAFRQAVFACLYRFDDDVIAAARGLAVLGDEATPDLIGGLVRMPGDRVEDLLDALEGSGLLVRGRFRHPVARATVLATLSTTDRVALHCAAARLLYERGCCPTAVARHFVTAGQVSGQWAVPVLRDAALNAIAADRTDFAAACLELARSSCTDKQLTAELTMETARLEWRIQPSAAARHLPELRAAVEAGHLRGEDAVTVARFLLWYGRVAEAASCLQPPALDGAHADDPLLLDLHALMPAGSRRRVPPTVDVLDAGAADPGVIGQFRVTADAALWSVVLGGDMDAAVNWAEKVLTSVTLEENMISTLQLSLATLLHGNRPDLAASWCETLVAEAQLRSATAWEALINGVRAEVALRQGNLADAETWAREALRLMRPHDWGVGIGLPLSVLIGVLTAAGRTAESDRLLRRQVVPDPMFRSLYGPAYLHARGRHFLATKRWQAALVDFQTCGELLQSWGLDFPVIVPWRTGTSEALIALGRPEGVEELVAQQLALPGAANPRIRGMSLRTLAAARPPRQRPVLLREAADLLGNAGDGVELVVTLAALHDVQYELGEYGQASVAARLAQRAAADCGAEELSRRLLPGYDDHDFADLGERPHPALLTEPADRYEELSEAERRVAKLAALGHSNREISSKLYITTSTVEQHLTRVYRKLAIARRSDLPLHLAGMA